MPYARYRQLGWRPTEAPPTRVTISADTWDIVTAGRVVPIKRPKPAPKGKFHTTLDQHQRGKLVHNLKWGFPPKKSAIDPDFLAEHIRQNGPYLYHGTSSDAAKAILNEGLYPHDDLQGEDPEMECPQCQTRYHEDDPDGSCPSCGTPVGYAEPASRSSWSGQFLAPRPGHVYLGTHKYASNYGGSGGKMLKIDLRKLDHSRINADEDHFSADAYQDLPRAHQDYNASLQAFDPPPQPMDWHGSDETLGDWADRVIGSDPEGTMHSLNQGSVAYNGHIPPEAVSVWTPGQASGDADEQDARHEASQFMRTQNPQWFADNGNEIHNRAATAKNFSTTWGQAYNQAMEPYSPMIGDMLENHLHQRLGETPAPGPHAGWDLNQDPGPPMQVAAATDSNHFEAKMWHGNQKGLLRGSPHTPLFMTDHQPEATTNNNIAHPMSVTFQRPVHYFADSATGTTNAPSDWLEQAMNNGNDGIVVHHNQGDQPQRTWGIALDPGTVVPGHDHEFPYA